jgi:hypothetical protein
MLSADDIALADRTGIRVVVVGPKSEGAAFIIYEPSTHEMFVVPR